MTYDIQDRLFQFAALAHIYPHIDFSAVMDGANRIIELEDQIEALKKQVILLDERLAKRVE